jgi:hypothetical protein
MEQLILAEFRDPFDEAEKKKADRLLCPPYAVTRQYDGLFYE